MIRRIGVIVILIFLLGRQASAQFVDDFDGAKLMFDPDAINGWTFFAGDGSASMNFQQRDGYVSILVDATKDQRNIWWALIRRWVSANVDLSQLSDPNPAVCGSCSVRQEEWL